jgi:hypothetical protein
VQHACPLGQRSGLDPAGNLELAQDVADMHAGCFRADVQLGTDLRVGPAAREEPQHRQLPGGQAIRYGLASLARAKGGGRRLAERDAGSFGERL